MPKVKKINKPETRTATKKRGRPSKKDAEKLYTFRCPEGCTVLFISPNASGTCSKHKEELTLV